MKNNASASTAHLVVRINPNPSPFDPPVSLLRVPSRASKEQADHWATWHRRHAPRHLRKTAVRVVPANAVRIAADGRISVALPA